MEPETKRRRTTDDAPRSIKIIAYLLMMGVGADLGNLVAGPILRDEFILPLGAIASWLAALGLMLAYKGCRTLLIVGLVLGAVGMMVGMGITGYELATGAAGCDWWVFGQGAVTLVHILMILAHIAILALVLWQLEILFGEPVKTWFDQPKYPRVRMTRRTMHMMVLFAALGLPLPFLAGIPPYLKKPFDSGHTIFSGEKWLHVSYGYRFRRLAYVVFVERPGREWTHGPVRSGSREGRCRLTTPQGQEIGLPTATQLYEIIDGKLGTSPERVTKEEFEAFTDSSQDRFTIDALLSFVRKRAANSPDPEKRPD